MTDDESIAELLARWEERSERGEDVPAEELCADHPHLTQRLADAIREMKSMAWMGQATPPAEPGDGPAAQPVAGRPALLGGRYRLDRRVGVGGQGEVWLGFDQVLRRPVAVKRDRSHDWDAGDATDSLLAEARRVARLRHPGILPVYDVGRDEVGYFVVTEYMPGGTLADRIALRRPDVAAAVRMARQVAAALAYAHRAGVVHRDLKLSNVLVDEDGDLCLADFGIALTLPRKPTNAPQRGTPAYMSPEQFGGAAELDARSDVYSLGILLYELLTGRTPFAANSMFELRDQVLRRKPRLASELNPLVPAALAHVVARCLEKNPLTRFADAAGVNDALGRLEIDVVATAPASIGQSQDRPQRDEVCCDEFRRAPTAPDLSLMLLAKRRRRFRAGAGAVVGCALVAMSGVGGITAITLVVYYAARVADDVTFKVGGAQAVQNAWDYLAGWAVVAVLMLVLGLFALRHRMAGISGLWAKGYYEATRQPTRSPRRSGLFRDKY